MANQAPVNPAPPEAALATFVFREVVAVIFIVFWLVLFAGELLTGAYEIPFWFHACSVGVLAYALGSNVAQFTALRHPGPGAGGGGMGG